CDRGSFSSTELDRGEPERDVPRGTVMHLQHPLSLARSAVGFVPGGWWRRPPYLPVPDRSLVRFRMETAYGNPAARPEWGDVEAFLEWSSLMRRQARAIRHSV